MSKRTVQLKTPQTGRGQKAITPDWIQDILREIDAVVTPKSTYASARGSSSFMESKLGDKITTSINFAIASLGFAFSVVNAVYLSSIDKNCKGGYNTEERTFLYAVSILLAIFFGILTISSVYGIGVSFS